MWTTEHEADIASDLSAFHRIDDPLSIEELREKFRMCADRAPTAVATDDALALPWWATLTSSGRADAPSASATNGSTRAEMSPVSTSVPCALPIASTQERSLPPAPAAVGTGVPRFHLTVVREPTDSKVVRLLMQALKLALG